MFVEVATPPRGVVTGLDAGCCSVGTRAMQTIRVEINVFRSFDATVNFVAPLLRL